MELIFLGLVVISGLLVGLAFWWNYLLRRRLFLASLRQVLLLIELPSRPNQSGDNPDDQDVVKRISKSAELFSLLGSLGQPFAVEVAVPHIGEAIHFFISISADSADSAERQIHGLWPDAVITRTSDFNIFHHQGAFSVASIKQKFNPALPIRTYEDVGADTFAPILSGLSKINEVGEGAALQIIITPLPRPDARLLTKALDSLNKGNNPKDVLAKGLNIGLSDFAKAITPATSPSAKTGEQTPPPQIDETFVSAVTNKLSHPSFAVNIRLCASAATKLQADSIIDGLAAGINQLSAPKRNELKPVRPRNPKRLLFDFTFRHFSDKDKIVLNTHELASLFHLPDATTATPHLKWLSSRQAPPPANLPATGVLLGENVYRGESRPVRLTDDDRRRHFYTIGQTGTGKSTLLKNMALHDIRAGKGVCLLEPHGDMVNDIASLIPDNRLSDVILFDPADFDYSLGLNMLEFNPARPEEKTFIVNEIQSILNRLFSQDTMGPMFEQYMRNTLLLLMEDAATEPPTLIEVPRVLTDAKYRRAKLSRIANPSVVDFWTKEAEAAGGEAALSNMAPYITSKFNNFIANDYLRPIIGQPKSAFNFRQLMDTNKILLVNLSKGKIGDLNASLLGMIIVGKILMAALSRVDQPESERRDFNLFIDEFQNFTTDSISVILSEARKYHLNLVLAHQFLAQLTEPIRDSIFGNVGSLLVFRVGTGDTEILSQQFSPVFTESDLINVVNFNAHARLLINGQPSTPFNLKIYPSDFGEADRIASVREASRRSYGLPRQAVEEDIFRRLRT